MPSFLNNVNLNKQQLLNAVIQNLASDPAAGSSSNGMLYYNTASNVLKVYAGGAWTTLATGSTAAATTSALGTIQLAGDLGGTGTTATAPVISTGAITTAKLADASVTGGTAGAGVKIAATTITAANIANATITDVQVAAANKDGVAGTASLRTLGTGAQQAASGTDSRFTDARTPTAHAASHAPAGSDALPWTTIHGYAATGSKPAAATTNAGYLFFDTTLGNLQRSNGTTYDTLLLTDAAIATANKDGTAGTASLRTIGTGALQAMAGNTTLSSIAAPTASVSLNTQKLTNVLDPTLAQDAATKNYVDSNGSLVSDWKQSVKAVATANVSVATPPATIDGYTLVAGDRVLLTAQTTATENGIYVVATPATNALTRAADATSATQLTPGAKTYVEAGTLNQNAVWTYLSGAFTAQIWTGGYVIGSGYSLGWGTGTANISGTSTALTTNIGATNASTVTTTGLGIGNRTTPAAAIDLPSSAVAAGGIAFGANEFQVYRDAANSLTIGATTTKVSTLAATTLSGTPNFSGAATGQTAAVDTSTTQLATTGFVIGQASAATPLIDGTATIGTSTRFARADHIHPTDTTRSPLAGSASLVTVGTITTGVWNGTALTSAYVPNLSGIAAPNASVSLNSQKITNLLDPTAAQDGATKNYVDNAVTGLDAKASVRVATTGAETFTVAAGAVTQINGLTIDGITVAIGDRILIKDAPAATGAGSANSSQPGNGLYTCTANTTNLTVARATDMDTWLEVPSAYTWIEVGTANADTGWIATSDQGGTLNTTAITWSQFSASTTIQAGNGLSKTGNTLAVVGTANRISVSGAGVDISSAYVGQSTITTLGTIGTGVWQGTAVGTLYGGTGATTISAARTNLSSTSFALPQKYAVTITGDGVATSFTITHSLGTTDIVLSIQDSTGVWVMTDYTAASTTTATVTFGTAPANGVTYRVIVVG